MRFFVCAAVLAVLSLPALAQSTPKAEIFGGFSYLNYEVISVNLPSGIQTLPSTGVLATPVPTVNFNPRMNLFGWNGSVTADLLPWFGFTSDFGGDYSNATRSMTSTATITTGLPCVSSCNVTETYQLVVSDPRIYTFLFGPQFSLPAGKAKLFTHFLVGGMNRSVTTMETITASGISVPLDLRYTDEHNQSFCHGFWRRRRLSSSQATIVARGRGLSHQHRHGPEPYPRLHRPGVEAGQIDLACSASPAESLLARQLSAHPLHDSQIKRKIMDRIQRS
ncbi:MAG TPA: hypothetical protein VGF96_18425 [Terracidiphilus sp.]|jgi:hypothetical protein